MLSLPMRICPTVLCLLILGPTALAQRSFDDAIPRIVASIEPAAAKPGDTVTWTFTMEIAPGWHSYPTVQVDEQAKSFVTTFKFPESPDLAFEGMVRDPDSLVKPELAAGINELRYLEGAVTWSRKLRINPKAQPGYKALKVDATVIVCDKDNCLPPNKVTREATLTVLDNGSAAAGHADTDPFAESNRAPPKPAVDKTETTPAKVEVSQPDDDTPDPRLAKDYRAEMESILAQITRQDAPATGLWAFILAGIFWGGVSLVTPCVFPMIPITVSFFLKQSEKQHHKPVTMALVYCSTIVVVLTIAAVLLLSFFRYLSVNPIMNFALGGLFIFFSLSLFGMYEIELPQSLAQYTSSKEGQGGLLGTMFMALTFTIISFACVAPFLGGFGGTAATSGLTLAHRVLGGLAFAVTFASPFFFLAIFPSLLKKMPRSGNWLNNVKVVMGFLELAAALKFLRAGELVLLPTPAFFTFDLVLGIWVALCLLCGLYLLNLYRLPHDTPAEHLTVPRLMFASMFLSLGFYLLPALFKHSSEGVPQRPNGAVYAWIDSFLLPDPQEGKGDLEWRGSLRQALADARKTPAGGKRALVFIDFTGETCTNCKINERSIFSKPDIKALFKPYKLVQLYTDKVPDKFYPSAVRERFGNDVSKQRADAQVNLWFQFAAFQNEQLPLYVILEPLPDGKTIRIAGVYPEGRINDEAAFAKFLKEPLAETTQVASRP